MNDQTTPWGLLLSFGGLIIIVTVTLILNWRYASNRKKALLITPFICIALMLTAWESFLEDLDVRRPYQKDPPVLVGWPEYSETLIVLRSKRVENAPGTVTTKCLDSRGTEVLIFHKDEGLRKGDVIETTSEGMVNIVRKTIPQIAGQ